MKAVIYARYSSDNQRDASIEDQLRQCRWLFAGKMTLSDVQHFAPLFEDGTLKPPHWLPGWVSRASGLAGMLAFSLFANRIRLDQIPQNS